MKKYVVVLIVLALFGLVGTGIAPRAKANMGVSQCATLPCVVASVTLTAQALNIPATPIFTPSANGLFRISTYISTTAGTNKSAEWQVFSGWTDEIGARKGETFALQNNTSSSTFMIEDLAGNSILYQTKLAGGGGGGNGGMTYNLFLVVEQLQ